MDLISVGEVTFLSGVALLITLVSFREARCVWQWKRTVGKLDRDEWTRFVRTLRDD